MYTKFDYDRVVRKEAEKVELMNTEIHQVVEVNPKSNRKHVKKIKTPVFVHNYQKEITKKTIQNPNVSINRLNEEDGSSMEYDIFISYRRKSANGVSNVPAARSLQKEFVLRKYKTFFDYSDCTDNYFADKILPAIQTCRYFLLLLTRDCLDRCFNEGDWVRREIEESIKNNKKIVAITINNECTIWPTLPPSLKQLNGLQITTIYDDHMFESSIDYLIKNRMSSLLNND